MVQNIIVLSEILEKASKARHVCWILGSVKSFNNLGALQKFELQMLPQNKIYLKLRSKRIV